MQTRWITLEATAAIVKHINTSGKNFEAKSSPKANISKFEMAVNSKRNNQEPTKPPRIVVI